MLQPSTVADRTYQSSPESRPAWARQPLAVRSFGITDCGRVRDSNEDQFLIATLTKALYIQQSSLAEPKARYSDEMGHIFVVADGMGGAPAGKHASSLAVRSIEEFLANTLKWFFHLRGPETESVLADFQEALRRADAKLFEESAEHPELDGMGTTLTLAYSLGANLFVAHVGDSRCYLCRDGQLVQLTHDHTLAADLSRKGPGPWAQKISHRFRHIITNAIGGRTPGVRAEIHKCAIEAGDALLLATDGLTRCVSDDQIAAILAAEHDPQAACERLVTESLGAGGKDNVTVIVARYDAVTSQS
jgi:PPM family protein phosphatase